MSLQVSAQRRTEPGNLDLDRRGMRPQRLRQLLGNRAHRREQAATGGGLGLGEVLERGEDVLLELGPEPLQLADPLILGCRPEVIQ